MAFGKMAMLALLFAASVGALHMESGAPLERWNPGDPLNYCSVIPSGFPNAGYTACCPTGTHTINYPDGDDSACNTAPHCGFWGNICSTCPKCWDVGGSLFAPVGATGDPHLTNIEGTHFDVRRPGTYTLLELPRGAHGEDLLLTVSVRIEDVLGNCKNKGMYIRALNMSGSLLHEFGDSVSFITRPSATDAHILHMLVGQATELEEQTRKIVAKGHGKVKAHGPDHAPGKVLVVAKGKGHGQVVEFQLRGLTMTLEGKHAENLVDYMDVQVVGLGSMQADAGGLLGHDNHTLAATPPKDCKKKSGLFSSDLVVPPENDGSYASAAL